MNLKKYTALFRLRFTMSLQYRAAALAGVVTQFAWGFLRLLAFRAFYRSDPAAFPMTLDATASYIWMEQAFLAFFMTWIVDQDILDDITSGGIAYMLCRPIDIFAMWTLRNLATRLARGALRCLPILLVASFLPEGYRLSPPPTLEAALLFLPSMALGLLVSVGITVFAYTVTFVTLSPMGIRTIIVTLADFLNGSLIPLPFFPDGFRECAALLPFASSLSTPLRVYSGDLAGTNAYIAVGIQLFWVLALLTAGKLLLDRALRRAVVQGG